MSKTPKSRFLLYHSLWPSLLLFLSLFITFSHSVFAERLPIKIYTSADGVGSGYVDYLMRDSHGFMWFCTRDGLSRFDGAKFVTFRIGDKDSPPGIERIYEFKSGIYWITTTRGTFRFDPNKIPPSGYSSTNLQVEQITEVRGQFFEDGKGNIWSVDSNLSLVHEKDGKLEFEKYPLNLPPDMASGLTISEITESPDGSLWLRTTKGIIRLLPDKRLVYYSIDSNLQGTNHSLTPDRNGNIWAAFANVLFVVKPEPPEFFANAPQITVKSFSPSSVIELEPEKGYQLPQKDGEIFQFTGNKNGRFIERVAVKRGLQTSNGTVWISAAELLLIFI